MTTTHNKFVFKTNYSRRFPDPLNRDSEEPMNVEHFILLSKAQDVPQGMPTDPNPREQDIDKGIYREVARSLENQDEPTFHLKNKGITILCRSVEQSDDKKNVIATFGDGDGIVDGAHSYRIILDCIARSVCPDDQYVKIEIITGVPKEIISDIAGGLNTAVQVQKTSLANLEKRFDWLKDLLKLTSYGSKIGYKENEDGKDTDIREIIALLTLFNIDLYPDGESLPRDAYSSKAKCLEKYLSNEESYKRLTPIVKDILELSDYVHVKSRERYNEEKGGKAGRMKGVFNQRGRGSFKLVFSGGDTKIRLHDGALYPILGSMRYFVQKGENGKFNWKCGSFAAVKKLFDKMAAEMIRTTYNTSLIYGRKPNAVGKDENLWSMLYKTAKVTYLENGK